MLKIHCVHEELKRSVTDYLKKQNEERGGDPSGARAISDGSAEESGVIRGM